MYIGRRTDDAVYEVERHPPYRVVRAESASGDPPITPALLGMPASFIVYTLEPEQRTLIDLFAHALSRVRPGEPKIIYYRTARYGGSTRVAEVVDRGEKNLFVFCHVKAGEQLDLEHPIHATADQPVTRPAAAGHKRRRGD